MAEMEMVERAKAIPVRTGWIRYGALPVRAVVLREEFNGQVAYSAHGLERDIAAQGSSPEQAMRRLQICATFDAKLDHTRAEPLGAAPPHVHDWHAAALTAPKERGVNRLATSSLRTDRPTAEDERSRSCGGEARVISLYPALGRAFLKLQKRTGRLRGKPIGGLRCP